MIKGCSNCFLEGTYPREPCSRCIWDRQHNPTLWQSKTTPKGNKIITKEIL
jgi:hypothetical protein